MFLLSDSIVMLVKMEERPLNSIFTVVKVKSGSQIPLSLLPSADSNFRLSSTTCNTALFGWVHYKTISRSKRANLRQYTTIYSSESIKLCRSLSPAEQKMLMFYDSGTFASPRQLLDMGLGKSVSCSEAIPSKVADVVVQIGIGSDLNMRAVNFRPPLQEAHRIHARQRDRLFDRI